MGIGRLFWRMTGIGNTIDTIKSIKEEGSLIGGLSRMQREHITEDNPITKQIYKYGEFDGKKAGYAQASEEYEKKLMSQASKFLDQKKVFDAQIDEYESLLDEFGKIIDELRRKNNRNEKDNQLLRELVEQSTQLKALTS